MGREHTHYANCLMLLMICLFASAASAQYRTNAWPSWQYPREGAVHAQNSYDASMERWRFAPLAYNLSGWSNATPNFWRSQQANLITNKLLWKTYFAHTVDSFYTNSMSIGNFSYYIDKRVLSGDALLPWLNSQSNSIFVPPATWDIVASNACLPTNYLDYTPARCLAGDGPFTNDTAVGHAHGWTNAYTQAGGPHLPPGRSVWYTTDYGWAGITSIVGQLDVVVHRLNYQGYGLWYRIGSKQIIFEDNVGDWASTLSEAQTKWDNWFWSGTNYTAGPEIAQQWTYGHHVKGGYVGGTNWGATVFSARGEFKNTVYSSPTSVWYYTYFDVMKPMDSVFQTQTYDANGTGYIENEFNQVAPSGMVASAGAYTYVTYIGPDTRPNACAEPVAMQDYSTNLVQGWQQGPYWLRSVSKQDWLFK